MAKLFADAEVIVVTSLISPFAAERDMARAIIGDGFHEVHVQADRMTCETRDPKDLYANARAGQVRNFTGIDLPYEAPANPELVVDASATPPDAALAKLVGYVEKNIAMRLVPRSQTAL